ncbi:MAG: hypothetical protein IM638_01965 [Bacteroidetes bacterium]|nr:hypothetical protein [Bacteroidota bacterium]
MNNVAIVFPGSQLLAEKLYRQRWWWIMSFAITLLWSFCYYYTRQLIDILPFHNEELSWGLERFFQVGVAGGYIHLNLFLSILFIVLTSHLFKGLQRVCFPGKKPVRFLMFQPGRMIELLEEINKSDASVLQKKEKHFWNTLFAFIQPVYLFIGIFPIVSKLYAAGLVTEWVSIVFYSIQFFASISWIIVLFNVFSIFHPRFTHLMPVHQPQYQVSEEEKEIVKKKIDLLRNVRLKPLVYQILGLLAIVFALSGYIDWNSLLTQVQMLSEVHLLNRVSLFAALALSGFLLYYLTVLIRLTHIFENTKTWLNWLVVVCYLMPVLATASRIYAIVKSSLRWNKSINEGEFGYSLRLSDGVSIWWAIVFALFSLYNTGYFIEFFVEHAHPFYQASWRSEVYNLVFPSGLILLHVFMLLLVVYNHELEEKCKLAADELEQSYFPQLHDAVDKHTIEPSHPDASAE